MVLHVSLTPEDELRLRQRAAACGQPPERLASDLLRMSLRFDDDQQAGAMAPVVENGIFHEDRWRRVLTSITTAIGSTPPLPAEALSREALYHGHD